MDIKKSKQESIKVLQDIDKLLQEDVKPVKIPKIIPPRKTKSRVYLAPNRIGPGSYAIEKADRWTKRSQPHVFIAPCSAQAKEQTGIVREAAKYETDVDPDVLKKRIPTPIVYRPRKGISMAIRLLRLEKRRQKSIGYHSVSHKLVERRVSGVPTFHRSKIDRKRREIRAILKYRHPDRKTQTWVKPQRHRVKSVFQYQPLGSPKPCRWDRSKWYDGQVHREWDFEQTPAVVMDRQVGREKTKVVKKAKMTIPFDKIPEKDTLLGPGRYDAIHHDTFDHLIPSKARAFEKQLGRFDSDDKKVDGDLLDLDVKDTVVKPRVRGVVIQPLGKEKNQKTCHQEDLNPNFEFGKKAVGQFPAFDKQLGRAEEKESNQDERESLQLDIPDHFQPRGGYVASFDKMLGRPIPEYRYNQVDLNPNYDLGWTTAKGVVPMDRKQDRWVDHELQQQQPEELIYEPERADGLVRTKLKKGAIDLSKDKTQRLQPVAEAYPQADYEPNYHLLSTKRNEKAGTVNMQVMSERWTEQVVESMETLTLRVNQEYLSKRRRVTTRLDMSKGPERFE